MIEVGRVCVKSRGRKSAKKCVVVEIIDKNFVLVTGPSELTGIKRKRINIRHIEPLDKKINIKASASDAEVTKALEGAKLLNEFII